MEHTYLEWLASGAGCHGAQRRWSSSAGLWAGRRVGSTYMEKLVMKAFLGSSISKMASCASSALFTTRLVMTVWANREETLESTVRL